MNKKFDQFAIKLKTEFGIHLRISAGIFLFVLFFQPFPLSSFSFNNYILFVAGISGIIFLAFTFAAILLPLITRENTENLETRQVFPPYLKGLITFLISSVSSIFYLRYVGGVKINFFIAFRVILICIAPPVILDIQEVIHGLRKQVRSLISERKAVQKQVEKYEEDYLNKSVEFKSENNNENLVLHIAEIVLVRSADNYVEIVFKEGNAIKRKMIRNTLKNIEQQIKQYSNFLRCHRICIVNMHFVDSLKLINNSYSLIMKDLEDRIPVSRQYLLKLKEAL